MQDTINNWRIQINNNNSRICICISFVSIGLVKCTNCIKKCRAKHQRPYLNVPIHVAGINKPKNKSKGKDKNKHNKKERSANVSINNTSGNYNSKIDEYGLQDEYNIRTIMIEIEYASFTMKLEICIMFAFISPCIIPITALGLFCNLMIYSCRYLHCKFQHFQNRIIVCHNVFCARYFHLDTLDCHFDIVCFVYEFFFLSCL